MLSLLAAISPSEAARSAGPDVLARRERAAIARSFWRMASCICESETGWGRERERERDNAAEDLSEATYRGKDQRKRYLSAGA